MQVRPANIIDQSPFPFAGLWEIWDNKGKEETPYRSCMIITREASESVMPIHNRMPVMLKPGAFEAWYNRDNQDVDALQELIQHQVHTDLIRVPVSKQVNSVKNNGPENIAPMKAS